MVKISGKSTVKGKVSFFSHLHDSDNCDIKTTTQLTKEDIEARKYGMVGESERHKNLKNFFMDLTKEQLSDAKVLDRYSVSMLCRPMIQDHCPREH